MAKDNAPVGNFPDSLRSGCRNQIALILEASSPLSAGTARTLASLGSHLALHYRPDSRSNVIALSEGLSSGNPGIRITMHPKNLSSPSDFDALFSEVAAKHGKVDFVVNGMGTILQKPVAQLSDTEREQMLAYTTFVGEQGQDYSKRLREELEKRRQVG